MFIVVRVTGVYRMERLIPLLIVIFLRYWHWLRNFSRDKELLLLEFLRAFVQLRRYRSRLSVFGRRWYPMQ